MDGDDGWKRGLKALAIYRDGSKNVQVLSTSKEGKVNAPIPAQVRKKMPRTRQARTHDFRISGHHGYITVGLYDDGTPGELWLEFAQEGSTLSGMMDAFAKSISTALQYGVPLESLVRKFKHMAFDPAGMTDNKDIPVAKSIIDYVFRWLGEEFLGQKDIKVGGVDVVYAVEPLTTPAENGKLVSDGTACFDCGALMVRIGGCEQCQNCGATGGCS